MGISQMMATTVTISPGSQSVAILAIACINNQPEKAVILLLVTIIF